MTRIAIFASGAGTNAAKIIETATQSVAEGPLKQMQNDLGTESISQAPFEVVLVVCNKPGAGVLAIAEKAGIPVLLIEKERFIKFDGYLPVLGPYKIDLIVLAGFLWKIPVLVVQAYPKKIINIHPALLPKFGGRGMYGHKVHEAVIAAKENESGITIHYVDEFYDHGEIIFQAKCPVEPNDDASSLANKIHVLEHTQYPKVIAGLAQKQKGS